MTDKCLGRKVEKCLPSTSSLALAPVDCFFYVVKKKVADI